MIEWRLGKGTIHGCRKRKTDCCTVRHWRRVGSLGSSIKPDDADLREVFESELILGCNIMRHPEFAEGVRALLVDKDRNPAWTYPDLRSVPDDVVEPFFVAPADMPALGLPE